MAEAGAEVIDGEDRIKIDKDKVQELCEVLSVEVDICECTRFLKRLGPRVDDNPSPRPLLVGFKEAETANIILHKSPKLAEKNEPWSQVSVIKDITKTQRNEEKKLREDVKKKNDERTAEESENWEWKVVGRRGERKLVKVAIEEEEEVAELEDGDLARDQTTSRGRGRKKPRGKQRHSRRLQENRE